MAKSITIPSYIQSYERTYWQCRDLGHTWDYTKVTLVRNKNKKLRGYSQEMVCNSCGTLKTRWIEPNGDLGSAHYTYPEGYLIPSELGSLREDKPLLRLVMLNSNIVPTTEWVEENEMTVEA